MDRYGYVRHRKCCRQTVDAYPGDHDWGYQASREVNQKQIQSFEKEILKEMAGLVMRLWPLAFLADATCNGLQRRLVRWEG